MFKYTDIPENEIDAYMKELISHKFGVGTHGVWKDDEKEVRNGAILRLAINQIMSKPQVISYLVKNWGIHSKTARTYYDEAFEALMANYDNDIEKLRQEQLDRLQSIANEAIQHGERKTAIQALEQMGKINGMFTENKNIKINDITFDFQ